MLDGVAASLVGAAGLLGHYYDDVSLQQLATTRIDPQISFTQSDWPNAPSGTAVVPDNEYAETWTGYVKADAAGDWTFYTLSDDGVRLWVDNTLVIDNWSSHTAVEDAATVQLWAGWHPIRLEHFQQGGPVAIQLSFAGPGQTKAIIPSSHLDAGTDADYTVRAPEGGVPRWWNDRSFHQDQVGFVKPVALSGVTRVACVYSETLYSEPVIVSGTLTFTIRAYGGWGTYEFPAPELRYRYLLHTPNAAGNDIRTPLSGILEGPQLVSWDSTSIPDGTYAVSVELVVS